MKVDDQQLRWLEQEAESADIYTALNSSGDLARHLKRLARKSPEDYASRAAAAQHTYARNLARVTRHHRGNDDTQQTIQYGRLARRQLRRLPDHDQEGRGLLAQVLADLGYAYATRNNLSRAASVNRRAIALYRDLAKRDRRRYLGELASAYYTASIILGYGRHYRHALMQCEQAADLFQQAARINPADEVRYHLALESLLGIIQDFGDIRDYQRVMSKHG